MYFSYRNKPPTHAEDTGFDTRLVESKHKSWINMYNIGARARKDMFIHVYEIVAPHIHGKGEPALPSRLID